MKITENSHRKRHAKIWQTGETLAYDLAAAMALFQAEGGAGSLAGISNRR
jgi:hypothetical protein